jgi:hypothetical protein
VTAALIGTLAAVAVVCVGVRWWRGAGAPDQQLDDRDVALAAGCAVAVPVLCAAIWSGPAFVGSDYGEHCAAVTQTAWDLGSGSTKRGHAVAWLLAGPTRWWGVPGGLLVGASASLAATAAGLFAWGRALGGRVAGVVAALGCVAVGPVAENVFTASFAPALLAAVVWASAGAAIAVRWPTPAGLAVGLAGATAALVVDVRTLPWGLAALTLVLLAAGWALTDAKPWRPALVVVVGLGLSLLIGRWALPQDTLSLAAQLDMTRMQRLRELGQPMTPLVQGGWTWGRLGFVAELQDLMTVAGAMPADAAALEGVERTRTGGLLPWLPVLGLAPLGLVALRSRPLQGLAAGVMAVPFVLALWHAGTAQEAPRFLALGLPIGVLGVALLVGEVLGPSPLSGWKALGRSGLAALALVVLVTGLVPSWLSPKAAWREQTASSPSVRQVQAEWAGHLDTGAVPRDPYVADCVLGLSAYSQPRLRK